MYKPDAKGNPQTLTNDEDTNLTGGTIPADVFYDFMKVALDGVEVQDFPTRAGVGDDKIPTPTPTFTPHADHDDDAAVRRRRPPAPTTTTTQAPPTTTHADAADDTSTGRPATHHGHDRADAAAPTRRPERRP